MQHSPRQPTTKGPAEWFSGDVYVDALARHQGGEPVTLGCVRFTPCAHTAWHRHSLGQTLYCTEGEGLVQAVGIQAPGARSSLDPERQGWSVSTFQPGRSDG